MATETLKPKTKKTLRFQVQSGASVQEVELRHVVDGANSEYAPGLYSFAESKFRNPQNVSELILAISGKEDFPGTILGELEEVAPDSVIDGVAEAMMTDEDTFAQIAALDVAERHQLAVDYLTHEQQQRANKRIAGQVTTRQLIRPPSAHQSEPTLALAA